jgi:predicted nucleic acid-binding protein
LIGWLLDTNVISEVIKRQPDERVVSWLADQPEETLYVSVLTLGEGDQGLAMLDPENQERARLALKWQGLEERFQGRILSLSDTIVRRWGSIAGVIRRKGRHASVIDTLLAATALEHNLYFVTRNTDDVLLCGAALFDPWKDNRANFPLAGA